MALVGKAVELRADLADLGDHQLLVGAAADWRTAFMKVRLTCTSKRRVPKNGILSLSTWASSITSPVLIRLTAFITAAGFLVIARAALVAGAPFGRAALLLRRHRPAWGLLSVGC